MGEATKDVSAFPAIPSQEDIDLRARNRAREAKRNSPGRVRMRAALRSVRLTALFAPSAEVPQTDADPGPVPVRDDVEDRLAAFQDAMTDLGLDYEEPAPVRFPYKG